MQQTRNFICEGPLCQLKEFNPTDTVTNSVIHIQPATRNKNDNWELKDGWGFVKGLGACCPRCIKELGLKFK